MIQFDLCIIFKPVVKNQHIVKDHKKKAWESLSTHNISNVSLHMLVFFLFLPQDVQGNIFAHTSQHHAVTLSLLPVSARPFLTLGEVQRRLSLGTVFRWRSHAYRPGGKTLPRCSVGRRRERKVESKRNVVRPAGCGDTLAGRGVLVYGCKNRCKKLPHIYLNYSVW